MADEQRPSPFGRPPTPPAQGGPSPFARPPGFGKPDTFRISTAPVATAPGPTSAPASARSKVRAGGAKLPMGLLAGVIAATIGAALWAGVTVLTGYQIGWMAVGIGALVGVAVRAAGQGSTRAFGILGAALALTGCLVGNLLTGAVILGREWDVSVAVALSRLTPDLTVKLMTAIFNPIDLLFYALAIWQGYKLSIVKPGA